MKNKKNDNSIINCTHPLSKCICTTLPTPINPDRAPDIQGCTNLQGNDIHVHVFDVVDNQCTPILPRQRVAGAVGVLLGSSVQVA